MIAHERKLKTIDDESLRRRKDALEEGDNHHGKKCNVENKLTHLLLT